MKAKETCSYLYADGHAVICYEQTVKVGKSIQTLEYVVIHEKWTDAHLSFKGRLCFSRYSCALLTLAKRASHIRASIPSTENGSDNTRRLGIAVGNLSFEFPNGQSLYWNSMPAVISDQFTYQPDHVDAFNADATRWGNDRISEIVRAKPSIVAVAQAA